MMQRSRTSLIVFVLLLGTASGLVAARDRWYGDVQFENRQLYVASGSLVEKAALSYDAVLADVYWVRAIQHFGGDRINSSPTNRFDLLFPMLDITTSLDPLFSHAYRFGAIFLSEPYPGGAGRPDLAVRLLEKGIRNEPDRWWYYHDAGFVTYWHLRDYAKAADWFDRGAARPGAPWWLKTYAAVMLTRGGDRQTSRFMWQQIGESADNDWLRDTAQLRLRQLDALDQIDALERVIQEFARKHGKLPASWEDIVAAGLLRGIPADPSGTPYTLVFSEGKVAVAPWSGIHPLPTEPGAAPELAVTPALR